MGCGQHKWSGFGKGGSSSKSADNMNKMGTECLKHGFGKGGISSSKSVDNVNKIGTECWKLCGRMRVGLWTQQAEWLWQSVVMKQCAENGYIISR